MSRKKYTRTKKPLPPTITRRAMVVGGLAYAIGAVLLSRLYHLQFLQGEEYRTLAEGNRIKLRMITPLRGLITDRQGVALADNEQNYRVLIRPELVDDMPAAVARLDKLVQLDEKVKNTLLKRRYSRYSPPILLKEYLSWDEVAKIEFNSASIPGVLIEVGYVRYYPFSESMSHVLGYVGGLADKDVNTEEGKELLKLPDYKIGRDGLEKKLELELRGKPGVRQVEVNVHGQGIRELDTTPSEAGKEVHLTLDARLQLYTADLLKEESAGCIVMDIKTGDILTLYSGPSFDPNRFSKGIKSDYWKELNTNKKIPLMNKALAGQYPPGSTFKMLTGLAALVKGVVKPKDTVFCPGHFYLGNHRFNCWKEHGHGTVNLYSALAGSCDTYFYTMAVRTGIAPITEMMIELGLGRKYDLPLGTQRAGTLPSVAWKRKMYNQPWQTGDTVNIAIGQGYVLTTPLQLAVHTARIAGGMKVEPRIVLPDDANTPNPVFEPLNIPIEHLDAVREGMNIVVNSPMGTAYARRIVEPEFAMAGKTGTSQVRKILVRGQDQNKIPWEFRHHAWFVAYAPISDPRYACALIVEHGGGGASAAAPYVKEILTKAQLWNTAERRDFKNIKAADIQHFVGPMPAEPKVEKGKPEEGDELPQENNSITAPAESNVPTISEHQIDHEHPAEQSPH